MGGFAIQITVATVFLTIVVSATVAWEPKPNLPCPKAAWWYGKFTPYCGDAYECKRLGDAGKICVLKPQNSQAFSTAYLEKCYKIVDRDSCTKCCEGYSKGSKGEIRQTPSDRTTDVTATDPKYCRCNINK